MEDNYDEVINWISVVLNEDFQDKSFYEILKDGTVLCRLLSKVTGQNIRYKNSNQIFVQRENICAFINGLKKIKINEYELFQTVDLFEQKNLKQVAITLYALSRHLQKENMYSGPYIGPKLANKNKIAFSQEQLDKSKYGFHLQMGYDPRYEKVMNDLDVQPNKKVSDVNMENMNNISGE